MRSIFILLLLIASSWSCLAQNHVQGNLIDEKSEPVQYVGATFMDIDKKTSKYSLVDSTGSFKIDLPSGKYVLIVEQMGNELLKREFDLKNDLDLGVMKVDRSIKLEEITIEGKRPLIQQKIDRMVFNVESSMSFQGMSGLDAISNAPLIKLDEQNGISIIGKSSLSVMVNNRQLNLSGSDLMNYLRSLRSDDIARIEVITTPPSRFEAAGNSGIINIILKRNPNLGLSGNVSSAYIRNSKNGTRNGFALNYGGQKVNTSIKLRQYITGYKPEGTQDFLSNGQNVLSKNLRDDTPTGFGANLSFDFKLSQNSTIGLIYDHSRSNYKIKTRNESAYETSNYLDSMLTTNSSQKWLTPTNTLNLFYDLLLDSLGKKISIVANYLNDNPNKSDDFNTLNSKSDVHNFVKTKSLSGYKIYSFQSDLTIPTTIGTIETGLKYTLFDNSSDISYNDLIGNEYVPNLKNSNIFNYKEQNFAGYFSMSGNLSEKWGYNAGVRYEYTTLKGVTINSTGETIKNNYGKLFPTASLSYKKDENNVFALNYSRRIGRPGFQALNPFRWYSNPFTYTAGNPFLVPSINDNFRLSYTFKNKFTVDIYDQYGVNYYTTIARLNEGIYSTIYENSYDENRVGLNLGYYDTFFNIWEVSANVSATHISAKGTISEFENLKNSTLFYSLNNTIALDSKKNTKLMVNFWHQLPSSIGNIYMESRISVSPGVRTSFFDKQLQLNAVLNDLFRSIKNDGERKYAGYTEKFTQVNDTRIFTFGLTYTFGNNKVKGSNKNIRFDEKNRTY